MKWLLNFFRGTVHLMVTGADPECFLNSCARRNLPFWGVEWQEPFVLSLIVTRRALAEVQKVAARCQCTLEEERRFGLPFFLLRFKRRYALLLGVAICLFAISISSRFVMVIDVEGNETITKLEILSTLRQHGVRPGVYGPSIDRRALANQMLLSMDELSFFTLNLKGTRAEVIVRERVPKPELMEEEKPANVIATSTGIITHMEVFGGQPRYAVGDTVMKGEVLISGLVDIEEAAYSNADLGTSLHRARGKVYARTWHTLKAKIPLSAQVKDFSGEEESHFALNLFGSRMKFYRNGGISFSKYDKIRTTKSWRLSDGRIMPISLEKETFRQYETQWLELQQDAAEDMLKKELKKSLEACVSPEAEIHQTDYVTRLVDGFMEVTLLADCTQEIGKTVPLALPLDEPGPTEALVQ